MRNLSKRHGSAAKPPQHTVEPRLRPESPADAGLAPAHLSITDIEGARLLGNEARGPLRAVGFSDEQIIDWGDSFFAQHHEGDPEELIDWIASAEETSDCDGRNQQDAGRRSP